VQRVRADRRAGARGVARKLADRETHRTLSPVQSGRIRSGSAATEHCRTERDSGRTEQDDRACAAAPSMESARCQPVSFLDPLFTAVAWVIIQIHAGLSFIFPANSGWAWGLSIILLTVLMRILIFPLFVKQLHASRKMQELNPRVQELRKKYKNDRQRLNQEVMKLYQEAGANPLSGCLPLLAQFPIFISLFQVLQAIADGRPRWGMDAALMKSAKEAHIFGALISDRFLDAFPSGDVPAIIVTGVAVLISSTTTFFMMKASVRRSMMTMTDTDNPMMNVQKSMVYFAPFFGLFGLGFPLGVLMYWATSNTWTLAQSHYIYKKYPAAAPDGAGGDASNGAAPSKTSKGGATKPSGGLLGKLKKEPEPEPTQEVSSKVVRKQPVRQSRSRRKTDTRKN
jgi:YidC/Oxa1 family membrane protein insertase